LLVFLNNRIVSYYFINAKWVCSIPIAMGRYLIPKRTRLFNNLEIYGNFVDFSKNICTHFIYNPMAKD
jgi:hypothetical protein